MIKLRSIFKSAVQYMFLTCDIIGLHDIFLSTYWISDQSEKTYCVFIKQNNLMFKIHWNVLPAFFSFGAHDMGFKSSEKPANTSNEEQFWKYSRIWIWTTNSIQRSLVLSVRAWYT